MAAGFVDVCSLILTSAFFIGVIVSTALIAQKCQALIDATKDMLEERGWIVSGAPSSASASASSRREGGGKGAATSSVVMVKTSKKKMDHERYLDATQRGVIKALNASKFGAPSNQTTVNASPPPPAAPAGAAGPSPSFGGLGLGSTFSHFRSQLLLPPFAPQPAPAPPPAQPQLDHQQLESAAGSGQQGVGSPAVGGRGGGAQAATTTASASGPSGTGRGGDGGPSRGGVTASTRDSLYGMADRFSAWPSEKIDKAKRLKDQFLSKV